MQTEGRSYIFIFLKLKISFQFLFILIIAAWYLRQITRYKHEIQAEMCIIY